MPNSNRKRRRRKSTVDRPPKPYPDFPLGPAPCGYWQKRIRGKIHYFGKWGHVVNGKLERLQEDGCWQDALALYEKQREALFAGRTPRIEPEGLTIAGLCNQFLTAKLRRVESGELSPRSFSGYKDTTDRLVATFGKDRLVDDLAAEDFASLRASLAKQYGPVRLGNEIQEVRTVFKYGFEAGLIDKPMRFGPEFKKPSASVLRRHRASNAPRLFEAAEIRRLLDALEGKEMETGRKDEKTGKPEKVTLPANPTLRAMVLLGVNCGFGNADCSSLPLPAVDLKNGWIRLSHVQRPALTAAARCGRKPWTQSRPRLPNGPSPRIKTTPTRSL